MGEELLVLWKESSIPFIHQTLSWVTHGSLRTMRQIEAILPSGYSLLRRTGGEAEKYERPRSSGRLSTLCSSTMRPHGRLSNSHLRLQSPVQAVGVLPLVLHSPSTFYSLSAGRLTHSPSLQCHPFPPPPKKAWFPRSCSVVHPPENVPWSQKNNRDFGDSLSHPAVCLSWTPLIARWFTAFYRQRRMSQALCQAHYGHCLHWILPWILQAGVLNAFMVKEAEA